MLSFFSRTKANELSPRDAFAALQRREICLVDVRERGEWAEQHVEGAVHVPLSELPVRLPELSDKGQVVFYCRSGQRSAKAVELCRQLGAPHDTHVTGGIMAWRAASLPVVR